MEPFLPNMHFNTTKDLKANSKITRFVEEKIVENHTVLLMSKIHQQIIHQKHERSNGETSPNYRNIPVTEEHLQTADRYVGSGTTSFSIYK